MGFVQGFTALGVLLATSAWAREPAADPPACELHVWPAGPVRAMTQGWVQNHVNDLAYKRPTGGFAKPEILTPERQATLLRAADLPSKLGLPAGTMLVAHDAPLPRADASRTDRHIADGPACYAELILHQVVFDDAALAKRSLKTLIAYRRFDEAAPARFSTWAETDLSVFPAKRPELQDAADAELIAAYGENLREFARYATAPKKAKTRG